MDADLDSERTGGPQREAPGVLLSPPLEQGDWSCLRLVYQITGSGSLDVLQRAEGRGFDRPLWSSQVPSDSWVISSMDLQNSSEPSRVNTPMATKVPRTSVGDGGERESDLTESP